MKLKTSRQKKWQRVTNYIGEEIIPQKDHILDKILDDTKIKEKLSKYHSVDSSIDIVVSTIQSYTIMTTIQLNCSIDGVCFNYTLTVVFKTCLSSYQYIFDLSLEGAIGAGVKEVEKLIINAGSTRVFNCIENMQAEKLDLSLSNSVSKELNNAYLITKNRQRLKDMMQSAVNSASAIPGRVTLNKVSLSMPTNNRLTFNSSLTVHIKNRASVNLVITEYCDRNASKGCIAEIKRGNTDAIIVDTVERAKKQLVSKLADIPAEVDGPYKRSSPELAEILTFEIKQSFVQTKVSFGTKGDIYILTKEDGSKHFVVGDLFNPDYAIAVEEIEKSVISSETKQILTAARRFLKHTALQHKDWILAYTVTVAKINKDSYRHETASKLKKQLCVRMANDTAQKKGSVLDSETDLKVATYLVIADAFHSELQTVMVNELRDWMNENYETLPYVERCVLYLLRSLPGEDPSDFSMSPTQIKKALSNSFGITEDFVYDALESLEYLDVSPYFDIPLIEAFYTRGRYRDYYRYQTSDILNSVYAGDKRPFPKTTDDIFSIKSGKQRTEALCTLSPAADTPDKVLTLFQEILDYQDVSLLRSFLGTPEGKRTVSLLTDKDRLLAKYMFEGINGLKTVIKNILN